MAYIRWKKNSTKILICALILIAVMVTVICISYIFQLKRTMQAEMYQYMSEISEHIAAMIDYRVESIYENLESIAETYSQLPEDMADAFLQEKAARFGFLYLAITDRTGNGVTTSGDLVDFSRKEFFRKLLRGEQVAIDRPDLLHEGNTEQSIFYCVPLMENGQVTGALVAAITKEEISNFLGVESFNGQGFSYVIDQDGNFVVRGKKTDFQNSEKNFFSFMGENAEFFPGYSLEEVQEDMEGRKSGYFYYTATGGEQFVLSYTPLSTLGWYLLERVSASAISERSNLFIGATVAMNAVILLLFLVLIVLAILVQRKNQLLEEIAYVDPVTKGMNREKFEILAKKQILKAPANSYAMVSLDIERFKLINDSFGSDQGNETLRHIYRVIDSYMQEEEIVARSTADTFYVLLKNTGRKHLEDRLNQIAESINAFNQRQEQKYYLTLMEGIFMIDDPLLNFITIQDRANTARKNAKKPYLGRRHSCVFYSDVERLLMIQEKDIENRMEEALENREFLVYLQPKYELVHDTVSGAEALVRWNDPKKGLVPPNDFIPVFEKNGFIVQLDLFVFEEVCKILEKWIAEGKKAVPISVNLSRVHLYNADFLEEYKQIFAKYDVPAELIEIELTETIVFENMDMLLDVIREIHACGFTCSLDDFGSGYSSLNMLKEIPVDTLKLDRKFFVNTNQDNGRGDYVIAAVIDLAKKLDMKSVSEGVEELPQVAFLKKAKCDMVQGFVFSRPVTIKEFERLAFADNQDT